MEDNGSTYEEVGNERGHEVKVDTHVSKCPTCGANLVYCPELKKLRCEYCNNTVDIDLTDYAEEIDFRKIIDDFQGWDDETRMFQCSNCGARTIVSKKELSPVCPYCGTSNVVEEKDIVGLKPNAVLPFLIGAKEAGERFMKWARKKFFAPRSYKKSAKAENLRGNYYPAFTFDSNTFSTYTGTLGEYYYVTVRRNGQTHQERRVRYFNISGTYSYFFNDVLVYANRSKDEKYMSKLLPFMTDYAQKYNEDFLHGFSASQYEKDGTECWQEAQERMRSHLRRAILSQYRYDVVASLNINTSHNNVTYKYMLLPVYVGHSKFRKKTYNFYVNGQNGNVAGKTPVSPVKVSILATIGAAILAGLGVLIYFLVNS